MQDFPRSSIMFSSQNLSTTTSFSINNNNKQKKAILSLIFLKNKNNYKGSDVFFSFILKDTVAIKQYNKTIRSLKNAIITIYK